ncbi:MAG: hypothetical protein AAFU67_06475 [Bacteroidota bacterium]
MKSSFLLLFIVVLFPMSLTAQRGLEGVWEGHITIGGIYSDQKLPMQLYITLNGRKIEGRTYVQLPEGETIQMHLTGRLYFDNSMELWEEHFVGDEDNAYLPKFNRQYQIMWKRDLWNAELRGYWQEVTENTFDKFRQRGRIKLKKQKSRGV